MENQSIKEYLRAGGNINVLPPFDPTVAPGTPDVITRPTRRKNGTRPAAPKDGYDPGGVCEGCKNKGLCYYPCNPLEWIGANRTMREKLVTELNIESVEVRDYNKILADTIDDKRPGSHRPKILKLRDLKKVAVAALLDIGLKIKEIATVMKCTERTVWNVRNSTN